LEHGAWKTERKLADYRQVTTLARQLLESKTKDLRLAVWLTEAQTKLSGFEGLASGLQLVKELLERFWETLYPELDEDGDADMRAAPLGWLGGQDLLVRSLPLTDSGLTYLDFMDAQKAGREQDAALNAMRRELFETARQEGKTTLDDWERSVSETRRSLFATNTAALNACIERLNVLKGVSEQFFGDYAPDYRKLDTALDEVRVICERVLWQKDPPLSHSLADEAALEDVLQAAADPAGPAAAAVAPAPVPAEETARKRPTSRAEAIAWILQGAAYLRGEDPYSATAYRLVRVLRWGELGAPGAPLDAASLTPPPPTLRQEIRALAAGKEWGKLLAAVEQAMAVECGRGWLDLQRHAYRACEQLGDDYREVRLAIRAEVRSLLETYPDLVTTPLADDTPTANFETVAWLRESVLTNNSAEVTMPTAQAEEGAPEPVAKIMATAAGHAAAGNYQPAIDALRPAIARQASPRMRFRLKALLAAYCRSAGLKAMARSVLQELTDQIEALHLEEWEAPEELAAIYAGLYHCLEGADGHTLTREALYSHICRLDPSQAPPR
jgi:type VI secretion system protein ImpA